MELPIYCQVGLIPTSSLHEFFDYATFGSFNYQMVVLKLDATHAFSMPTAYIPPFSRDCEHVHSISNMRNVLQQADAIYNFADYDSDLNGIVYICFASMGLGSGGYAGSSCLYYLTDDYNASGQRITVSVITQIRGSGEYVFIGVTRHELGHTLFNLPDLDHDLYSNFNHYGIGGFDVMSNVYGFNNVPSLYNP